MTTVVGVDLGTQAVKVLFYDGERRQVAAVESAPLALYRSVGGVAEQQHHWWLAALREAFGRVGQDLRRSAGAVAVSGQQHGLVAVDEANEVLAPVKLWCDTSTERESAQITRDFGGVEASLERTGNAVLPGYTASKIRWLKQAHPRAYDKLDAILLPHDFINLYLTGERCMELGDASGTGFLNIRRRQWDADMLRAIDPHRDLRRCLPPLRKENESIGGLLPHVADELGVPVGIPVAIGGGDNMMAAIGTGNVRPGRLTMSLGTSGTVYACADEPVIDPQGHIAAFCSSTGGWLPLLCTMNCTLSTELMRALLGAAPSAFEAQIGSAARGAEGVLTLPFFNGERTPNLPNGKGCILGLNGRNAKPENLLRSAVEGATFALKAGIDRLEGLGVTATDIALTGGGVRSPAWRQIVADICALPVTVYAQEEGAAFGAALQALQLLEPGSSIAELTQAHLVRDDKRCCEPQRSAVNPYRDAYRHYREAVTAISALYV